jgi:uncharacterized protein (TIGR04255 family)
MSEFMPTIQDRLRKLGYKVNASAHIQEISISPQGPKSNIRPHWEFQNPERTSSVVVNDGFVVFQTTAYDTFDDFFQHLQAAVDIVADVASGLLVQRVGLRYVDLIRPGPSESWKDYLREGLHGFDSPLFQPETIERIHQTVARTAAGTMVVRIVQNRQGVPLPADVTVHNLAVPPHAQNLGSALATIVDMDHYREDLLEDYKPERLSETAWQLKNRIYETFTDYVVTKHAMEVWE